MNALEQLESSADGPTGSNSLQRSDAAPRVILAGGLAATTCDPREAIPLAEVPDLLPRRHGVKAIHISTVLRWANRGIVSADGQRLKLPNFRCGRRLYTHRHALEEFIRHLTDPAHPTLPAVGSATAIDDRVSRRLRGRRKER